MPRGQALGLGLLALLILASLRDIGLDLVISITVTCVLTHITNQIKSLLTVIDITRLDPIDLHGRPFYKILRPRI